MKKLNLINKLKKINFEWLYKASRTLTQYKEMPWMASKKATAFYRLITPIN
jgi:hypothetical protein